MRNQIGFGDSTMGEQKIEWAHLRLFSLTRAFWDPQDFERAGDVRWRVQRRFEPPHSSTTDIGRIRVTKRSARFDRSDVEHRSRILNNRL